MNFQGECLLYLFGVDTVRQSWHGRGHLVTYELICHKGSVGKGETLQQIDPSNIFVYFYIYIYMRICSDVWNITNIVIWHDLNRTHGPLKDLDGPVQLALLKPVHVTGPCWRRKSIACRDALMIWYVRNTQGFIGLLFYRSFSLSNCWILETGNLHKPTTFSEILNRTKLCIWSHQNPKSKMSHRIL